MAWFREHFPNLRNPWLCWVGAPIVTVAEIILIGGLIATFLAFLVWLCSVPMFQPQPSPDTVFLLIFGHTFGYKGAADFIITLILLFVLGCGALLMTGTVLFLFVRWNYRSCHNYWYPEEKQCHNHLATLLALAPELDTKKEN